MPSREWRGSLAALAPLLLLAAATSCSVFEAVFGGSSGPAPRAFSHEKHTQLDCTICHEGGEAQAKAGMPGRDLCMSCHVELDKDRPPEKTAAWFFPKDGAPSWSAFTKQSEEIIFSHQAHAKHKIACAACHEGIDRNTGLLPDGMRMRMSACMACHERQAKPEARGCRTCHTRLDEKTPPPDHAQLWERRHGLCARLGAEASTSFDCALCHKNDACTACHQTKPPSDHTDFFRVRAHGILADADRSRCLTCHRTDFCDRCHRESAPLSHAAGWNAPQNRHCTGCHLPLPTSGGCFVCHKTAPGHAAVPPWPVWHTPALNCRSCHAATMKHPDNGDACTHCHR